MPSKLTNCEAYEHQIIQDMKIEHNNSSKHDWCSSTDMIVPNESFNCNNPWRAYPVCTTVFMRFFSMQDSRYFAILAVNRSIRNNCSESCYLMGYYPSIQRYSSELPYRYAVST
ncbi:hypothetical protein VCUG_01820 [Vavraia culicis subsp. floridensis]|uniref:Uncharacterized protein n=1 Tax=Vavraia culicis (isolate floridensis) TaxID=948595 RepID=L2GU86_VAVCU|nr:uncharacterized protein VCUG_01820 [Vavraia culicis subsp. floridensis]ELA46670.1 hypothetical protein VCUG_01820 [Vavraia culicis subsp. floridensis]